MAQSPQAKKLQQFRQKIDQLDQQLVELLAQRVEVAAEIGLLKQQLGQPVYVPEREQQLLEQRRAEAERRGLNPNLLEDVLRRVIEESYLTQLQRQPAISGDRQRLIVIVGAAGRLGRRFQQWFQQSGYRVHGLELGSEALTEELAQTAQLVLVCTPMADIAAVLAQLPPLAADCVVADIGSSKSEPLKQMLTAHSGPVLGMHPMFGPNIEHLARQRLIVCHGRQPQHYQWLLQQFQLWGAECIEMPAAEHDQAMAWVQGMRHLTQLSYASHLVEQQVDIEQLAELSSPLQQLQLLTLARLFQQHGKLYQEILFAQQQRLPMFRTFIDHFENWLKLVEDADAESFIAQFEKLKAHLATELDRVVRTQPGLSQRLVVDYDEASLNR
ncbi:bifunctional chorismate mutase/prephenate dehydrogenase [Idiomarina tyrosinivorans]|uniref:chorismate mutase n=1 Tax=Idiomarina tyrosinivorans TaxID=1445662 RepID=A0A432ZLR5_9GAMM|nr:bifunctional chorismate mutase/prephenate dehydrogenase [Idiomarina tyrosinivorans]RUO78873.1 bifunctional chorismate mutase/prephenate dehydrogenase [Idiomarina tyrosinivorans]